MSDTVDGAGKGFKSSALLVVAVLGILLAGLMLKTAPPADTERSTFAAPAAPPEPTLGSSIAPELGEPPPEVPAETPPVGETVAPTPARPAASAKRAPAADPAVVKLATRAGADCGRLSRTRGPWTAQLLVACKPETVDRLLAAGGGSTKIYVLPARVKDDACFRVCYGSYASAKDAALAADLPQALRGKERIGAVEIAKVVP